MSASKKLSWERSSWLQSSTVLFVAVVAIALPARLLYLWQVADQPFMATLLSDSRAYWQWAGNIASGDWASRDLGTFYQAPLYPYFLALVRSLGGDLGALRLLQALLGALSCGLVALAGRRLFSPMAGLAAGGLLALYAPAIFFDGLIQKTSLALFWMVLLLYFLAKVVQGGGRRSVLSLGITLGLLILVRENALLLVPVIALWLAMESRSKEALPPRIWQRLGWLGVGLLLTLSPVAARNLIVGGELALTTSQAGPNFYIGNNPRANGTYAPLRPGRSDTPFERRDAELLAEQAMGRSLSAGEVSGYWFRRSLRFMKEQPAAWLRLMAWKTVLTFHRHELTDADDFYLYREKSSWLNSLAFFFNLGWLLPLAAGGVVLSWPRRQQLLPFYLVLATSAGAVILFYVFARYRFVLVPGLALFAGFACVEGVSLGRKLLAGQRGRSPNADKSPSLFTAVSLATALAVAVSAAVANAPIQPPGADSAMPLSNLGAALAGQGRYEEAIEAYRDALDRQPDLMEAHLNLGGTLVFLGQPRKALPHLQEARRLAPKDPEAAHLLGRAYLALGKRSEGLSHLQRAQDLAEAGGDEALAQQLHQLLDDLVDGRNR